VGRKVAGAFFFLPEVAGVLVASGSERRTTTAGRGGTDSCRGWFKKM
jgi:hypothetical protein